MARHAAKTVRKVAASRPIVSHRAPTRAADDSSSSSSSSSSSTTAPGLPNMTSLTISPAVDDSSRAAVADNISSSSAPSSSSSSSPNSSSRLPDNHTPRCFPLLALPAELRLHVYRHYFSDLPVVLDLDADNHKRVRPVLLALLRTCRLVRDEAGQLFWGTRTARIFPTSPGRFFKTKRPLLARLRDHQLAELPALELRLGPGWSSPPSGWVVGDGLRLERCASVKKVCVVVQCDPSDGFFAGFRRSKGFYEAFCQDLLRGVLSRLPAARLAVEFDAWSGVRKSGAMMRGLLGVVAAEKAKCVVAWGPERGWTDDDDDDDDEDDDGGEESIAEDDATGQAVVIEDSLPQNISPSAAPAAPPPLAMPDLVVGSQGILVTA